MIRTWMIFGLLSLTLAGDAQETFFEFVRDRSLGHYVKEREDETIRFIGRGAYESFFNYSFAEDINFSDEVLNGFEFQVEASASTDAFRTSYFEASNGDVVVVGQAPDTLWRNHGVLMRFDEFMESPIYISEPVRFSGSDTQFRSGLANDSGQFIIASVFQPVIGFNSIKVFAVHEDNPTSLIWSSDITIEGHDIIPLFVKQHPDGGYVLTTNLLLNPGGNQGTIHSRVYKLSPEGQLEWSVMPGDHENFWTEPGATVVLEDGSIMTFHTQLWEIFPNTDQPNPERTIYFERFSAEGELINSGDYLAEIPSEPQGSQAFQYRIYQAQVLDDGNVLISGSNYREGFLMKVTPAGEYLWHRRYSATEDIFNNASGTFTNFFGVFPSSDGGFLCTGEYRAFPNDQFPDGIQTSILVKLDEHGCLEEGCEGPNGIQEFDSGASDALSRLELWPNPVQAGTSTSLSVRLPQGVEVDRVEIVDMLGRISDSTFLISEAGASHQKLEIRNQEWASGLYSVMVTTRDGMRYSGKFIVE